MNIWLVNESTVIEDAEVQALVAPLTVYSRHIRTWWGTMQPGIFAAKPKTQNVWQLVIVDDADQAGALGYHDITDDQKPVAFVFAKTAEQYGYDWQITLSHEFAEMMLDPYIMRCEQTGNTRFHALELCDPVEADDLGYEITAGGHTLRASDFVTPGWFVPGHPGPKYDHLGHCTKPLQVLDGGYAYFWDGQWQSEDHLGRKLTVEEFQVKHPEKTRLARYARNRS